MTVHLHIRVSVHACGREFVQCPHAHMCKSPHIRVLPCTRAVSARAHSHVSVGGDSPPTCTPLHGCVCTHVCAAVRMWLAHACASTSPRAHPCVPLHTRAWQRRCLPWHSGAGGARGPRVHEGCPRDPTCAWRPCTRAVYTQGPRRPRQHKGCACTRPMCAQSHIHTQEHT